ncbi:GNAT family N-acetyltransferase [Nocardia seriolae]|nr:GNAT family N-acetyltransferase [Nocardia seriolae]MTL13156.1 GNAT family N-acetyltransferase [Nocardia seriolae]
MRSGAGGTVRGGGVLRRCSPGQARWVGGMYAGRGVYLGEVPGEAIAGLADAFAAAVPDAGAVEGAPADAHAFAERWSTERGEPVVGEFSSRLFRLGELVVPAVAGFARVATESDVALCAEWIAAFGAEAGGSGMEEEVVRARVGEGWLWLWEDGGETVSLAGLHPRSFGWRRIGPVYTPPAARGHGYASVLTAHLSQRGLADSDGVCLFTDLANPTSNKIYRAIGYEPVRDFVRYEFDRREA